MFTIFTIPKPFTDPHIRLIQRNAIQSWQKLSDAEVILIGDDEGVAEVAQEFSIKHIPEVARNEFGTPLLDSAFALAKKNSANDLLIYANADIVFLENLSESLKFLPPKNFLLVGQRIDLKIEKEIDFQNKNWKEKLLEEKNNSGRRHSAAGIDYFAFQKKSFPDLPPFAVGRVGWDNWMIYEARRQKMAVIDATHDIIAIHQDHGYPVYNDRDRKTNPEAKRNATFIKNQSDYFTIEDANCKLKNGRLIKKRLYWWPHLKRYVKLKIKTFTQK